MTAQELIDKRAKTNTFEWIDMAAEMLRQQAEQIEALKAECETRKAYGDEQTEFAIKNANERDALKADAERLDWIEKTHHTNVLHIGSTWYSRNGFNSRHKKHVSLREACDYAMKEKS